MGKYHGTATWKSEHHTFKDKIHDELPFAGLFPKGSALIQKEPEHCLSFPDLKDVQCLIISWLGFLVLCPILSPNMTEALRELTQMNAADTSRLYGLGYVMGNFVDGRFWLVTCGFTTLTSTLQLNWNASVLILQCPNVLSSWKTWNRLLLQQINDPWRGWSRRTLFKFPIPASKEFVRN